MEDELKGEDQEPIDLGQPTDIEEIKPADVIQDKEDLIQLQPFEGMQL